MKIKHSSSPLPILKQMVVLMFALGFFTIAANAMSLPSGISFNNNWVQGITGSGRWKAIQAVASDRMQTMTDPGQIGGHAVRVEVRPGDDPINSSGERAEALIMSDIKGKPIYENKSSGTQYYAFRI